MSVFQLGSSALNILGSELKKGLMSPHNEEEKEKAKQKRKKYNDNKYFSNNPTQKESL